MAQGDLCCRSIAIGMAQGDLCCRSFAIGMAQGDLRCRSFAIGMAQGDLTVSGLVATVILALDVKNRLFVEVIVGHSFRKNLC
jgi:hypothetical protein